MDGGKPAPACKALITATILFWGLRDARFPPSRTTMDLDFRLTNEH